MKKLFVILAVLLAMVVITSPLWAKGLGTLAIDIRHENYQDCLRLQRQGYAIGCIEPGIIVDTGGTTAIGITEEPATYEVRITLKYNAVTVQEAAEIAKQALVDHGEGACQVKVKIKKNGDITTIHDSVTGIYVQMVKPRELSPCDTNHEVEVVESSMTVNQPCIIDWGGKNCRYFEMSGFSVFKEKKVVLLGFRSDGVVVWRYVKTEGVEDGKGRE